jgi:hypothetical protein
MNCHNLVRLSYASCWPTIHGGKKVKWPSIFKLTQQHINNWEVGILFLQWTIFPWPVHVLPLDYKQIYNFFFDDKQYDVIIGNFPRCSCVYFVAMLVASLGDHGAYVQGKHVYHVL